MTKTIKTASSSDVGARVWPSNVLRRVVSRTLAMQTTSDTNLDDPDATIARRRTVQRKGFLRRMYLEWYDAILGEVPPGPQPILEVGSGGGFLATVTDGIIASDILPVPYVDVVASATKLPFTRSSLRAIVMTNVLHHIQDPQLFFCEAARCVSDDGAVVMLEPWLTPWSRFVYGYLHYEPSQPGAPTWALPPSGPLSGANVALPWILFDRDLDSFHERCVPWRVERRRTLMPLCYLLSGGMGSRALLPGRAYNVGRWLERHLLPEERCAMFALIVLRKAR